MKRVIQLPDGPAEVEDGGDIDLDAEEVYLADGTRLTNERAEEFVEEILASKDHQRAVEDFKRARGRPPLGDEPTERIGVRMTRNQRAALHRLADTEGRKVSAVLRDAVDEYLQRHAS